MLALMFCGDVLLDGDPLDEDVQAALRIVPQAMDVVGSENPYLLDTLARAKFETGHLKAAIRFQKAALKHATADERQLYEGALEEYRAAKNQEQ